MLYKKAATVATIATMAAIFFDDALDADGQVPQQASALVVAVPAALTVTCPSEPQHVPVVRPLQSHASDFMQDIAPVSTAPPHVLALPQKQLPAPVIVQSTVPPVLPLAWQFPEVAEHANDVVAPDPRQLPVLTEQVTSGLFVSQLPFLTVHVVFLAVPTKQFPVSTLQVTSSVTCVPLQLPVPTVHLHVLALPQSQLPMSNLHT